MDRNKNLADLTSGGSSCGTGVVVSAWSSSGDRADAVTPLCHDGLYVAMCGGDTSFARTMGTIQTGTVSRNFRK